MAYTQARGVCRAAGHVAYAVRHMTKPLLGISFKGHDVTPLIPVLR